MDADLRAAYLRAIKPAAGRRGTAGKGGAMTYGLRVHGWKVAVVGLLSGALLVWSPGLMSVATAERAGVKAPAATAVGNTYGGVTSQGLPVIVDMKATRRQIVRAVAGVTLKCTSGNIGVYPDKYTALAVTRNGKFRVSFGPYTQRNDDGTTTDFQGRMSGALNAAKTQIAGTWTFTATDYDAAGAVTDTCTSGSLTWKAKQ